jgi:PLP dependent protein
MKDPAQDGLRDRIQTNIEHVRSRIAVACAASGRDPADVKLIAVSKNFASSAVRLAFECGLTDFGENRIQEAIPKYRELSDIRPRLQLHFIGHLQTNKAKEAAAACDVIHSVDSLHLAETLDRNALRRFPVLVQVNVSGEESKYGFSPDEADNAVKSICALANIEVVGLMTIAPMVDNAESVRTCFARLREMNNKFGFRELSMGMTDDYEVAIEEGATMVRIGRAVFGERS